MSKKKETNQLIMLAEDQGWTIRNTGKGHVKFTSPAGTVVIVPATPGGGRSTLNSRARLRRAGLLIPKKGG